MTSAAQPIPIERARRASGPIRIEVVQDELVAHCMDMVVLCDEAMDAFGYALQSVGNLPPSPLAFEARDALKALYPHLKKVLNESLVAAGRYESPPRR